MNNLANLLKDKVRSLQSNTTVGFVFSNTTCIEEYNAPTQGDYAKAEELMREALEISEKAYGREHEDFALKLNNLAHLLRLQVVLVALLQVWLEAETLQIRAN